jgi:dTDP-4-dehydrorhamnose reductase
MKELKTLFYDSKHIVIIGATGKVAHSVIKLFSRMDNIKLTLFSNSLQNQIEMRNGLCYEKTNYENIYPLKNKILELNPNIIINLAAMTDVDGCEKNMKLAFNLNMILPSELSKLSAEIGAKFIHISTDYIFDGKDGPYTEYDSPNPQSVYGKSKLYGESEALSKNDDTVILRTNVVYGYSYPQKNDFVTWVINNAKKQIAFSVVNDQYSNPTLTDDIALTIEEMIRTDFKGILNIGGSDYCDRLTFAKNICNVFNLDSSLIKPISTNSLNQIARRPLYGGLKIDKLNYQFKIFPKNTVEGLKILKGYMDENNRVSL